MKLAYGSAMKSVLSLSPIPALVFGLCLSSALAETKGGALEADEVMIDDTSVMGPSLPKMSLAMMD